MGMGINRDKGSDGASFQTGSFDCPHCGKAHPKFVQRCPETGLHVDRVYKMSGEILEGKYEIGRLLGMGGMGVVYEATNLRIGRKLAIKFLNPQAMAAPHMVARFQNEARIAASVGHRNIVDIIDLGETPTGVHYIVMEHLDGRDLGEILDTTRVLPVSRSVDFAVQILSALRAVHEQGIVHRDLKPENVCITGKQGQPLSVKLVDFGVSRLTGENVASVGLTRTGAVLGTPRYMAPEQARGRKEVDRRADIYAVGVMLYRMLTGTLPFEAKGYNDIIIAITTQEPADIRTQGVKLPDGLCKAVMKSIERDPDARFPSALEFFQAIRPYRSWTEGDAETSDLPAPEPTLDWSIVTSVTNTPVPEVPVRTGSRYNMSQRDNPSGMVDVLPGRLHIATVKRDPSGASGAREERSSRPAPEVVGTWNEPGASGRRESTYSVVGARSNPSMIDVISPAARRLSAAVGERGNVATPVGRMTPVQAMIEPAHEVSSRQHHAKEGSLASVSFESSVPSVPVIRSGDSASIEAWVGPSSVTPARAKAHATPTWSWVAGAAAALVVCAIGATLAITNRLGASADKGKNVSAADAGPTESVARMQQAYVGEIPGYFKVDVGNLPEGAIVFIDGVLHPERPLMVDRDGNHVFRIEANGYAPWEKKVSVVADAALGVILVPGEDASSGHDQEEAAQALEGTKAGKAKKKDKKKRIDVTYPGLR